PRSSRSRRVSSNAIAAPKACGRLGGYQIESSAQSPHRRAAHPEDHTMRASAKQERRRRARPARDPVSLEILWSRLIAIPEEQAAMVLRTAFSSIVRESYDFTCVLLTPSGDLLAQPFQSLPGFTRCASTVMKHFLSRWPQWHPEDVAMTNDPWLAAGHLNDIA